MSRYRNDHISVFSSLFFRRPEFEYTHPGHQAWCLESIGLSCRKIRVVHRLKAYNTDP